MEDFEGEFRSQGYHFHIHSFDPGTQPPGPTNNRQNDKCSVTKRNSNILVSFHKVMSAATHLLMQMLGCFQYLNNINRVHYIISHEYEHISNLL